jgi:hypothetical protein
MKIPKIKKSLRFLENYNDDPYEKQRWLAWGAAVTLLFLLLLNIWENPSWPYIIFGCFVAFLFYAIVTSPFSKSVEQRLAKMQETRVSESFCQFSGYFRPQGVDNVIIKSIFAEIKEYLPIGFPIRPEDDLIKDYGFTKKTLREFKLYLSSHTGRSLAGEKDNLYYAKDPTVENLILFFDHQPFSLSRNTL